MNSNKQVGQLGAAIPTVGLWKRRLLIGLAALGLWCGGAGTALAQSKIPVYVSATVGENDQVGRRLVFDIRETIRASQTFELVEDAKQRPYMRYSLVTLRQGENSTIVSHVFAYDSDDLPLLGALITSYVQSCGSSVTQSCARNMVSGLDGAVDTLRRDAENLWSTLRQNRRRLNVF